MKTLPSQLATLLQKGDGRRNLRILFRFTAFFVAMVGAYTVVFHLLMVGEGQDHSWITGFYWTLTVMTTLGFGDITFQSDIGRAFSILVLLSGVVMLLIVLPFTFIQFFYAPWLEAQSRKRVGRDVPENVSGHVVIAEDGPVARSLIGRLLSHGWPYILLESDLNRALDLHDEGLNVVLGEADDVETYERLRLGAAALLVANGDDHHNANIAFTAREVNADVPIVATCRDADSIDILELAGADRVLHLPGLLGGALARRTVGGNIRANALGRFGPLVVAEAPVAGTPLVDRRLGDGWLRRETGLTVVGIWRRGKFELPDSDTRFDPASVLLLAGSEDQLAAFDDCLKRHDPGPGASDDGSGNAVETTGSASDDEAAAADEPPVTGTAPYPRRDRPVMILGGGRVGRGVARVLEERGVRYRIVEKDPDRDQDHEHYVVGNAADRAVLDRAGIDEAASVVVTTSDDATNVYLTVYCRRLRPEVQIVSRANLDRNVSTLHRAGADFVLSYASMGSGSIFNMLEQGDLAMIAEGLDVFRVPVPRVLGGVRLADSGIRAQTRASVIAVETAEGIEINPPADLRLPTGAGAELILIGTPEAQVAFTQHFEASPAPAAQSRV